MALPDLCRPSRAHPTFGLEIQYSRRGLNNLTTLPLLFLTFSFLLSFRKQHRMKAKSPGPTLFRHAHSLFAEDDCGFAWDTVLCWPPTSANDTVSQFCPDMHPDVDPTSEFSAGSGVALEEACLPA